MYRPKEGSERNGCMTEIEIPLTATKPSENVCKLCMNDLHCPPFRTSMQLQPIKLHAHLIKILRVECKIRQRAGRKQCKVAWV